jgi:DNA-binding GntR family transcriptional regulator
VHNTDPSKVPARMDSPANISKADAPLQGDPPAPGPAVTNDEARIQRKLADAIYEHRLPPGTKLAEVELCQLFGVTRGLVRKVLSRLAAEHLLDLIPNRGAFVARPSVDETRDVFQLRRILESGVLRCLAGHKHGSQRWLDNVRRQIADEREANRVGDTPRYIRLAGKFHLDLAAATGNEALEQHLKRVVSQTSLMVALYDLPGTNTCSFHEHLEILDAIEAGDYARAEKLMDEHLLGCERQLRLGGEPQRVDLAQVLGATSENPLARRAAASRPARNVRTAVG